MGTRGNQRKEPARSKRGGTTGTGREPSKNWTRTEQPSRNLTRTVRESIAKGVRPRKPRHAPAGSGPEPVEQGQRRWEPDGTSEIEKES
eukprot:11688349-Karenia_brevis.AAC.1